jgi:hypothetical protein
MLTKTRVNLPNSRSKSTATGLIRLAATSLAVAGWLGMSLPSLAANITTTRSRNPYRNCAGRLVGVGISADAAATACAGALNPQDVARCVVRIEGQTEIVAENALATCRQVRRPIELARCVVGISDRSQGETVPGVLDYCGRSLLPVRFAECVVGLRREIDFAPTQAMDTCISASDRPVEFDPTFIPQRQIQQLPVQSAPLTPDVPQEQTPPAQPAPVPTAPQEQTPVQPAPPTTPTNPGGV